MRDNQKLYIIVRADIPVGYRVAQSVHAAFRFATEYQWLTSKWMNVSEHICCVEVDTLTELESYVDLAEVYDVAHSTFHEPDMFDELTAVALEASDEARHLCQGLRLTGSKK